MTMDDCTKDHVPALAAGQRAQPAYRSPASSEVRARGYLRGCLCACTLLAGLLGRPALADTFSAVSYDAAQNELVITMSYDGSNPNHAFTLRWGTCSVGRSGIQSVPVEVLDNQWQDTTTQTYSKTTHFSLDAMPCRPARLSLRTAPRFHTTIMIPAAAAP
jgi:hypothetical protein